MFEHHEELLSQAGKEATEINRTFFAILLSLIGSGGDRSRIVFDNGCDGARAELTPLMLNAGIEVVGLEIVGDWLKEKRERFKDYPNLKLVCGDAHCLPFRDKVFDIVTMVDMIEHLAEPELALQEAHRCLGDEGKLVLSVQSCLSIWTIITEWLLFRLGSLGRRMRKLEKPTSRHVSSFTLKRITRDLTRQRFEMEQVISPYGLGIVNLNRALLIKCRFPILGRCGANSRPYAVLLTLERKLSKLVPLGLHANWVIVAGKRQEPLDG